MPAKQARLPGVQHYSVALALLFDTDPKSPTYCALDPQLNCVEVMTTLGDDITLIPEKAYGDLVSIFGVRAPPLGISDDAEK